MDHTQTPDITVNQELIALERGTDELLLVDPLTVLPLYIKKGRDVIKTIIREAGRLKTYEALKSAFPQDQELFQTLIRHRVLVTEETRPVKFEPPALDGCQKTSGISLYLLLSQSCNLGCIYCLNGRKTYRTTDNIKMGEEVAFKSIEKCLERLEKGGYLEIVFFGGEPMLNWTLVKKIIRHTEAQLKPRFPDRRIKYHMTSNLTRVPDEFLKWAKDYQMSILCDVDGDESVHNTCRPYKNGKPSHGAITANIKKLVDAGIDVSLRATITRVNVENMTAIARHHKSLGVRGSALVPLNPVNSDEELLDENLIPNASLLIAGLENVYHSRIWPSDRLFPFSVYAQKIRPGSRITMGCGAPNGNTPVVDATGDVYPCIYLMGIERFYMGNIQEQEWLNKDVMGAMQRELYVDHLEACRDCRWRYICGGSCPVSRLTVLNNPDCTDTVRQYCEKVSCDYTQKIMELLYWELAEEADAVGRPAGGEGSSVALEAAQTVFC